MILNTEECGIYYQHLYRLTESEKKDFLKNGYKIFSYYGYRENRRYIKEEIFVKSLNDLLRLCRHWSRSGYEYKPIIRLKARV
jgi:hypothetical protein